MDVVPGRRGTGGIGIDAADSPGHRPTALVLAGRAAAIVTPARLAAIDGVSLVVPPELGVVLFRRAGWDHDDWRRWATRLLHDGVAFVAPTTLRGEVVGRLVFLHPGTPFSVIEEIAATLARS